MRIYISIFVIGPASHLYKFNKIRTLPRFLKTTVVKYRNQIMNTVPCPLSFALGWLIMIFAGHCSGQLSSCLILKACRWLPFLSGLFPSRRPHISQAWSPALFTPRAAPRRHWMPADIRARSRSPRPSPVPCPRPPCQQASELGFEPGLSGSRAQARGIPKSHGPGLQTGSVASWLGGLRQVMQPLQVSV